MVMISKQSGRPLAALIVWINLYGAITA